MNKLAHLLANNRLWAANVNAQDPTFFSTLSSQQAPEYLWIGCADSRVPANEITGKLPGEIFVHRNLANVVAHSDLNCLSVVQYAVDVLKVKHIIVCGHYGCGGVRAVVNGSRVGLSDNWLGHVADVHKRYFNYLRQVPDAHVRADRLSELNVIEQVVNLGRTTIVQDAWSRGQELDIHGWIYALDDGLVRDLDTHAGNMLEFESMLARLNNMDHPSLRF